MFCSKCGARNEEPSKFCFQCGNRLEEAAPMTGQPQEPEGYRLYSQPEEPEVSDTSNQPQAASSNNAFSKPQMPTVNEVISQPQMPTVNEVVSQPQMPTVNDVISQPQAPAYHQQVPYQQGPVYNQPGVPISGQPQGMMYQQPYQQLPPYGQTTNQSRLSGKSKKPLFLSLAGIAAVAIIVLIVTLLLPSGSNKVLDNIMKAAKGTAKAGSVAFTVDQVNYYSGKSRNRSNGVMVYDLDKGKLEYDIENDDSRQILYDGVMYDIEDGEVWSYDYSYEIDKIMEYYDEYKEGMNGLSKIDWEEAIDEAGLSRYVDTDKMAKCLKEFEKNLNSKSYFKEVCDEFSVEKTSKGTKYTFDVDVPKLIESLLDTFEPVIDMDIEDIKDEVLDQVDVFEKLLIEITIKDDKLVELHLDVSMEDYYGDLEQNEITITFKNYGKASLDKKEIEDLIENSNRWD